MDRRLEFLFHKKVSEIVGFLRVRGCFEGEGVFLGNPKDYRWEDWGTLGNFCFPSAPIPSAVVVWEWVLGT